MTLARRSRIGFAPCEGKVVNVSDLRAVSFILHRLIEDQENIILAREIAREVEFELVKSVIKSLGQLSYATKQNPIASNAPRIFIMHDRAAHARFHPSTSTSDA